MERSDPALELYSSPVVWTTPEDIESKSCGDWCAAHTSFCFPLHHYSGQITLTEDQLTLSGWDKRTKLPFDVKIGKGDIRDLHLGWDNCFSKWEDRSCGATFQPLRIILHPKPANGQDQRARVVYVVSGFQRWTRSCDNKALLKKLQAWLPSK